MKKNFSGFCLCLIWLLSVQPVGADDAGIGEGYTQAGEAEASIWNGTAPGGPTYTTPSIPLSRTNGIYTGDFLYIALFMPGAGRTPWRGNLKKYRLDPLSGQLLDRNGHPATAPDGSILDTSISFWSVEPDGNRGDQGGAGALLVGNANRNLYTYIETSGSDTRLTASINAFSKSNSDGLTPALLGVIDDKARNGVVDDVRGTGKTWIMADVIHSNPVVVPYDTDGDGLIGPADDGLVFVGTNGGVLHAFLDSSGEELWGFIPPPQLGRLKLLSETTGAHHDFIDGAATTFNVGTDDGTTQKMLVFGERGGGSNYYLLDITSIDQPQWLYRIDENHLGGESGERLGQSWGRPQLVKMATSGDTSEEVLLFPGGYDPHQDRNDPGKGDSMGRAVFSVVPRSGALADFCFYNDPASGQNNDMTHSIVDLVGVDTNGDGITNSIYAPDLGGNVFAFTDRDVDGRWNKIRLFYASSQDNQRKIFSAPDVITITGDPDPNDTVNESVPGEMIFFGTGDRADLSASAVVNRFYAVKHYWRNDGFLPLTEDDLHDATDNPIVQGPTSQAKATAAKELETGKGWFIRLEHPGEKVVSTPVVYGGAVYFTTYTPSAASKEASNEGQSFSATGTGRLYAVSCQDGRAVHDDWSDTIEHDAQNGEKNEKGLKRNRHITIGAHPPGAPIIAIRKGVASLYLSTGDKIIVVEPLKTTEMNMYYWREVQP